MVNYKDVKQAQVDANNLYKAFVDELQEMIGTECTVIKDCNGVPVIRSEKELSKEMLESLRDKGLCLITICNNHSMYPFTYNFRCGGLDE